MRILHPTVPERSFRHIFKRQGCLIDTPKSKQFLRGQIALKKMAVILADMVLTVQILECEIKMSRM